MAGPRFRVLLELSSAGYVRGVAVADRATQQWARGLSDAHRRLQQVAAFFVTGQLISGINQAALAQQRITSSLRVANGVGA